MTTTTNACYLRDIGIDNRQMLERNGNWIISDPIQPRRMALYRGTESVEGGGYECPRCKKEMDHALYRNIINGRNVGTRAATRPTPSPHS